MRLVLDILILIARLLIAIGDGVIFLASFIVTLPKHLRRRSEVTVYQIKKSKKYYLKRLKLVKLPKFPKISKPSTSLIRRKRGRPYIIPFYFKFKFFAIGTFVSFLFIFLPFLTFIFIQSLPDPRQLISQDIAQTTKIYDRDGRLLYQIYADQNRTMIPLSEIPDNLKKATIAFEDKNFYQTPGFDLMAILRSAISDLKGEPLQGGSTITQQLIKARLLSPERSIERKVKEVILSVWAGNIYSKNQILEMYLNQVPYGGTAWGIEAASQTYFGKHAKDLNLAESAFLAGLPQAPSIYSPYSGNPTRWKVRQREVLKRMIETRNISEEQAKEADREILTFKPPRNILHAPYFVMYVKDWLVQKYGINMVERGGLSVVTSIDLNTQGKAEDIVREEVENGGYLGFTNAATLVTNPSNGDILAMVGGRDYYDGPSGNFNVTTALRQPGSTIKVVTYSAALMNGFTAATPILDAPIRFDSPGAAPYIPVNYDGKFHGNLTVRLALANSVNIPAIKTLNKVGIPTMLGLAKKMGITTWGNPEDYGLALTLGAAEVKMTDMATVFGTLANQGERVDVNPILKITDHKGDILEEKKGVKRYRVIPQGVAFIISNILSDNRARSMEFGANSPLVIPGHTVSVKTGTTDNKRDNWTIGYTPNLLVAVWVGNNNNAPMNPVLASGITGAAPIWNRLTSNLLSGSKNQQFLVPQGLVQKPCLGVNEYFLSGTENSVSCRPLVRTNPSPTPAP
ncbi:MAG: hypothetical protein ACD_37C00595G0002 [uncultured bacterium]|nr:MAG: hypothetical protein ACD_37C00595G0002 [uncultured bacterium]KKQ00328.1 MAG: Penicillin-binding protein [Candidatus Levybacteria bacterium GW2011_GWB1_36_18]